MAANQQRTQSSARCACVCSQQQEKTQPTRGKTRVRPSRFELETFRDRTCVNRCKANVLTTAPWAQDTKWPCRNRETCAFSSAKSFSASPTSLQIKRGSVPHSGTVLLLTPSHRACDEAVRLLQRSSKSKTISTTLLCFCGQMVCTQIKVLLFAPLCPPCVLCA